MRGVGFRNIKGRVSERSGSTDKNVRGKFRPGRCEGRFYAEGKASGAKSEKMPKHFPDFGARGKNRPRARNFQAYLQANTTI